ncbi:hypothetical protein [Yersinia ruckeri]|uniref:hypothetical protein n=1 Tax=Yersinia ruckeri TaxID=29486 RepID=UPI0022385738|nr:hypothetical protein [Yersinia ruckeri]MCW6598786.1 hypothetical protein [Yersinia ruckeri]
MILHSDSNVLIDALRISNTALDVIALDKISEGHEMRRDFMATNPNGKSEKSTPSLGEYRIYIAHSIFKLADAELKRLNEDYAYLAKRLYPITSTHLITVPRLIDPVDIETGASATRETRPEELVKGDLKMIESCDFFVYDFRHNKVSAGACMELFHASRVRNIPTIVLVQEGLFKDDLSPWIQAHASYLAWDMEGIADIINQKAKQAFTIVGRPTTMQVQDLPQRTY